MVRTLRVLTSLNDDMTAIDLITDQHFAHEINYAIPCQVQSLLGIVPKPRRYYFLDKYDGTSIVFAIVPLDASCPYIEKNQRNAQIAHSTPAADSSRPPEANH